ncbi:NFACT RNA binding domain-containing protein [Aquirufa sp. ROCK-SH2]
MHNNYYFLRVLAKDLRQKLLYARLKQCFSQEKDELVLGFERQNGDDFWIKCCLGAQFSILQFPESFHRAGRNSVDLFSDLLLAEVQEVQMFENERAFAFHFLGSYVLLFKLYGNRANVVLYQDQTYISQFQKRLKKDESISLNELDRPLDQSFDNFIAHESETNALFPTFGKECQAWLKEKGYEDLNSEHRWKLIQQLLHELSLANFYIYEHAKGVSLTLLETHEHVFCKTNDPIEALNQLYAFHWSVGEFKKEKNLIHSNLEKLHLRAILYREELLKQQTIREENVALDEIGHILMANLHAIPEGAKSVELLDFYRNKPLKIKLNASLSPVQNAENYYRKSKNVAKELANWQAKVDAKNAEIEALEKAIVELEQCTTKKALKPFLKWIQPQNTQKLDAEELPFKEFTISGWTVWVGKNAKNNDLLTLKYAKKNDLWLHARDVSGSHVVIRNPQNQTVPKFVIEQAASLAAYFSKRQTETLCPVIVTPKKYVRKTRDLLPGQVIVDREEVVIVRPGLNY